MNKLDLSLTGLIAEEKLDTSERFILLSGTNFKMLKSNYQKYWNTFLNQTKPLSEWSKNQALITPGWYRGLRDHILYNLYPKEGAAIELFRLSPVQATLRPKDEQCIVKRISENPIQYFCYRCNEKMGEKNFEEHKKKNVIKFVKIWPSIDGKQYATITKNQKKMFT